MDKKELEDLQERVPSDMSNIVIQECSFHRNGVSGAGFYAVRFQHTLPGADKPENFLAMVFDDPGVIGVISLDRIEECGVGFANGNSWRGDKFEAELRKRIENGEGNVGVRVGPFAL